MKKEKKAKYFCHPVLKVAELANYAKSEKSKSQALKYKFVKSKFNNLLLHYISEVNILLTHNNY